MLIISLKAIFSTYVSSFYFDAKAEAVSAQARKNRILRIDFSALRHAASWHLPFTVQYRSCPVGSNPLTFALIECDDASNKAAYATASA